MDFDSLMACGSMSGSGGVIVMDDSTDMVEALANINYFYARKLGNVRLAEGVPWMRKITARMVAGEAREEDADLLNSIADQIAGRTICAFGEAASWRCKVLSLSLRMSLWRRLESKQPIEQRQKPQQRH